MPDTNSKRKVFFSFHYELDSWRVNQVKNMGIVEGQQIMQANQWEEVKKSDASIKKWINDQLDISSVLCILIGSKTSTRPWVEYEIQQAVNKKKGIVGLFIHGLKDQNGNQSIKGINPLDNIYFTNNNQYLSSRYKSYDYSITQSTSKGVYDCIEDNLSNIIEEAFINR